VRDARIVFGVLDTKEWREMVKLLSPFFSSWILVTPNSDRAVPLESIRKLLSSIGISDVTETSAQSSIELILEQDKNRTTVVSGSIYLIGGIRQALVSKLKIAERPIWTRNSSANC
jgi:dihydrofolate synthase/folylpolyglutamate synthase